MHRFTSLDALCWDIVAERLLVCSLQVASTQLEMLKAWQQQGQGLGAARV